MKKQLIQRLSQLNSSQNQLTPCKDDFLKLQVHQAIPDIGKFVTVCYSPCDPPKCTVSMVGGEEGVMYQTIAGQSVDFMLVIKDDKGCKVTKGGYEVRVQVIQNYQQILTPAVQDHGDGLYSFSCAGVAGIATLTVEVEGQNVRGCPFNWEVNPENRIPERTGQSRKGNFYDPVKQNAFREGRHSWKLQLVSFNPDQKSSFNGLEIGVESHVYDERGRKQLGVKWCWYYHPSQSQNFKRSDGQQPSITSVQDHDVFTVFLNLETKKLVIYNVRSKQVNCLQG
ncbi:Tripartite motif-containing protein 45 [Desmophyllum pertusum]|uniref:Tripartite motif-containing protein 45 n=1 Tax=Desmophyllum pertusum TaxID=174260 RepID=A0A9X0CND1_9CNID|nr:Tripartite motif-containing protein 45 [Desmophyllum pertusum]